MPFTASSKGLMTETGCASAARGRNGCARLFPLSASPSFLAKQKSRAPPSSSCACGPSAAAAAVPVMSQAIEAMKGTVSGQGKDINMATIGTFKKTAKGEFVGDIVTLSLQAKGVRIVPDQNPPSENAPTHRVFVGNAEVGAAWAKHSNEGRAYLGLKLDDPSFNAPIYANLFDDDGGEAHSLIWSRPGRRGGD
jgi:uncharacterized protein (DUF736 family)